MSYTPRHARQKARTGTLIVAGTAAVVAAVPAVALAQTLPAHPTNTHTTAERQQLRVHTQAVEQTQVSYTADQAMQTTELHAAAARNAETLREHQAHLRHLAEVRAERAHAAELARHRAQAARQPVQPAPAPAPVSSGTLSESALAALWIRAGGNPAYAHIASAIAMAESGGNQYAHSPSDDYGYWQINGSHGSALATYDPIGNAKAAILISNNGTYWGAWTTFTSGAYLRYM